MQRIYSKVLTTGCTGKQKGQRRFKKKKNNNFGLMKLK